MSEYLPPVVVELEGRHAQLLATLTTAKAEVRKWVDEVGRMKASVGVKLDLAPGEIQKIQRQVGQIKGTARVGLRIDETAAAAARARLDDLTRDRHIAADVDVRLGIAAGEIQKVQRRVGQIKGTARVGLRIDETTAATARARLDDLTRDRDVSANVNVRLDIAAGEVQKLQQRIGKIKATIPVKLRLDSSSLSSVRSRLTTLTRDRTVTVTTVMVGGTPPAGGGGGRGGSGGGRGALMTAALLSPALAPIVAQATAVTASITAAAGAVGIFGVAVLGQLSALGEASDATKKYRKAVAEYGATSQEAAKAQNEQARTMAQLPPATQQAAAAYLNLKTTYKSWSGELSKFTMKPVTQGIGDLEALLPKLNPLIKGTSTELTRVTTLVGGGINSSGFDSLMARFTTFANGALKAGVDHAVHFARVLSEGDGNGPFSQFMAYARQNGPLVAESLHNMGSALNAILKGAGEAGPGMLSLVNAAAKLVAALPPSVIATMMQIAAAIKIIALTRAGILLLGSAFGQVKTQILAMRAASVAAGGGLAGLRAAFLALSTAAKATVILAAIAAIGVAVAKLASLGRDAPPDIDALTNSLGRLGRDGQVRGEALQSFGKNLSGLRDAIKSFASPAVIDTIQQGIVKVLTAGTTDSTPVKEAKENVEAIDKALANLVQGGNADLAAAALEKMKAAYGKGGHNVDDFTGKLKDYKQAVDDAAFAAELTAQSQGLFGQQAQATKKTLDEQKASADGLRQSLQALNDVQRSALDGQIGFQAAMDAASKAAKDNGAALSMKNGQLQLGTQKARDEAQALSDLASKTDDAAAAARENGSSWSTVTGIYDEGRRKLIEVAQQMGLNKTEAANLANQILKVPDKTARVDMKTEDAVSSLDSFIAAVKKAPTAKSVTLKTLSAEAEKILTGFGYKVTHLKDGSVTVSAKTGAAVAGISQVQAARDKLSDKTITVTTKKVTVLSTMVSSQAQSAADAISQQAKNLGGHRAGGVVRRAAGGSAQYIGAGGPISGPGTSTSDSILAMFASGAMARVSDTEYVIQSAAVRKYGLRLLDALNSGELQIPAFAGGGATAQARSGLAKASTISALGRQAGYQHTSIEHALGKPADLSALISSINGLKGQIKSAFSGGTESKLLNQLNKAGKSLISYDKQLTKVTASLAAAKTKLDDLKSASAQLKSSVASTILSGAGVITQAPQEGFALTAQDVANQMAAQLAKAQQFAAQLQTLKARGLSGDLLQQIASAGVDQGGATAAALAGASSSTLAQLNLMQSQLKKAANAAGSTAADAMYGAGIAAAQGLVNGLTKQKAAIEAAMMAIAKGMEKSLKAALGIKSPSTVMAKLGDWTALGLARGIDRSGKHAVIAARGMAMSVYRGAALTGLPPVTSTLPALRADAPSGIVNHYAVDFTVEGTVVTERELRNRLEELMLQLGGRNSTTYAAYTR